MNDPVIPKHLFQSHPHLPFLGIVDDWGVWWDEEESRKDNPGTYQYIANRKGDGEWDFKWIGSDDILGNDIGSPLPQSVIDFITAHHNLTK